MTKLMKIIYEICECEECYYYEYDKQFGIYCNHPEIINDPMITGRISFGKQEFPDFCPWDDDNFSDFCPWEEV